MEDIETLADAIQGTNAGFMFIGRTTPPTRGHIMVMLRMIELRNSIDPNIPIMLNLSPSSPTNLKKSDNFEDPLFCEKKIEFITSMLTKLGVMENIYPVCLEGGSTNFRGPQLAHFLEERDLDTIVVFIGRDRFDTSKGDPMKNYTIIAKDRSIRKKIDIEVFVLPRDVETDETAGKRIRKIILENKEKKAIQLLRLLYTLSDIQLLDDDELLDLYRTVRRGMRVGRRNLTAKNSAYGRKKTKKR